MVLERKRDGNVEKNRKNDDLSDVWCVANRSKKQRGVDGHVGFRRVGSLKQVVRGSTVMF